MKPKMMVKISIDFVMTILLLLLMARQITGESAHEWLGAGMFLLWVVHHILNFKWHGNLFKGGRKIFCVYGKNSSLIRNRYV